MPAKIPMRDVVGTANPRQVMEFGNYIGKRLKKAHEAESKGRTRSGLISGGKLGQPTLWAVLDILGIDKNFDEYLLGKFQRGHDVEARAIQFLTDLPYEFIIDIISGNLANPGWVPLPDTSMLKGEVYLQMPTSYRGSIGYIDLAQRNGGTLITHEVKSSTKMAYDRVAGSGRSKDRKPEPYYHHGVQLSLYALGEGTDKAYLHYFNADDYRLCSFSINPQEYKAEIDKEMDAIQQAFITKRIPAFEGFLDYHKAYMKSTYGEWNNLPSGQVIEVLKAKFPAQYAVFMGTTLPTGAKK